MKLFNTFFLTIITLILLGIIMVFHPKDGIKITKSITLQYPTRNDIFELKNYEKQERISGIIDEEIADIDQIDEQDIQKQDSLVALQAQDSIRKWQLQLHYPENDKSVLYAFFEKLLNKKHNKKIRIVHYGDSQIEGDRITGFLRHKLQEKFGGEGPGLISPVPLVYNFAINQEYSKEWKRYTRYGLRDSLINHNRYGALASFGRFAPLHTDSAYSDTISYAGSLEFKKRKSAYTGTHSFSEMKLFYGYNTQPVQLQIYENGALTHTDTLAKNASPQLYKHQFNHPPQKVELKFSGNDSPDIYAISLEGYHGINVDNIALRGASGTLFTRINTATLNTVYNEIQPDLILMQFGGNAMPSMETEKQSKAFARNFEKNIKHIQQLNPNAAIIVIGPSDMSYLNKTKWETYPMLPTVVNDLKQAAFNSGAAYWDIYEAMGGINSMPIWVESTPPLAAQDHIHFTGKGAQKVAHWFYNALVNDFNDYILKNSKSKNAIIDTLPSIQ